MIRPLALTLLWLALMAAPVLPQAPPRASVTIYSRDLAFVRETRTLDVRSARDTVRLTGIPERIDVSSVRLVPSGRARVSRLAYQFDVASGERLLERARGRRVRVSLRENRSVEGTLLGADGGWLMVRSDDGAVETLSRGAVDQIRLAKPPADMAFEPALEVVVEGGPARVQAELSFLTGGLTWEAEHTLTRSGESAGQWSTVVTVQNTSGRRYEVPRLGLVAGDPRREGPAPPIPVMRMEMSMAQAKDADLTEQGFAEYHLYTLDRPAVLEDRETQTLTMLEARPVKLTPRYLARGGSVTAQVVVKNLEAEGLGVPLAAGRVRFFEGDAQGESRFTGETRVAHTPEGETLTLDVGTAFDLVAERREVYNRRISDREREYQIEVKLRNRKKASVTIVVEEPVAGDHEITRQSHESTRKDANTLQFSVPVAAGKEAVLGYTVRVRF